MSLPRQAQIDRRDCAAAPSLSLLGSPRRPPIVFTHLQAVTPANRACAHTYANTGVGVPVKITLSRSIAYGSYRFATLVPKYSNFLVVQSRPAGLLRLPRAHLILGGEERHREQASAGCTCCP
jgi:hypothetical protein